MRKEKQEETGRQTWGLSHLSGAAGEYVRSGERLQNYKAVES